MFERKGKAECLKLVQNVLLVRRISAPGKAWIGLPIKACTSRVTTKTYLRCDIMKKECSNCEFNLGGICAGSGSVYKYGEKIIDDTQYCDCWGASLGYYEEETKNAPRFLRDAYHDCRLSYSEFSRQYDDYLSGKAVPIDIFEAIKHVYGISMIDIAVVLNVSYGVVYKAKTSGFAKKRVKQFATGLCIPEKFLHAFSSSDFEELEKCKQAFFAQPNIKETMESMPEWKVKLAEDISSNYVHCPIHIARTIARVDKIYWNYSLPKEEYTESEQVFINYISRKTKKFKPIHELEYFLDNTCSPHMRAYMMREEN